MFIRNTTLEAAAIITEPVDMVYVDARHDYVSVRRHAQLGLCDAAAAGWQRMLGMSFCTLQSSHLVAGVCTTA